MKVIRFRTATVTITNDSLTSLFGDGVDNVYDIGWAENDEIYKDIARWAGYGDDWRRYGVEHDLTHHWLADRLKWRWSWSLHDNPPQPWPEHIRWEEHICNRLQRALRIGADDEYEVLDKVFGANLTEELVSLQTKLSEAS